MRNRIVLVVLLVIGIVAVAGQIFLFAQADLRDMDAIYTFVQREIVDIPRNIYDTWEAYYLDVTHDGVDELVFVSPYGPDWHPYMEIIRVVDRSFHRVPAEIPLMPIKNVPQMRDGFLAVESSRDDSGTIEERLDLYFYDGEKVTTSLLTLTLSCKESKETLTGEIDGPLTDFRHILINIDPLRPTPVIVRGVYHYIFDPERNSFRVQQLAALYDTPSHIFEHAKIYQVFQTSYYDLDGNGMQDRFRLETHEGVHFLINEERYYLPQISASDMHPYYELTRIEYENRYAFVIYLSSSSLATYETHFYEYTKTHGLSLMGMIQSDELLYGKPILNLYQDRVVIDYMVYPFFDRVEREPWHVDSDMQWLAEYTCVNIDGRFNLKGFINEVWNSSDIQYDNYVGVVIPMYTGVNKDLLTEQRFSLVNAGQQNVSFAIFGTMQNIVVSYFENVYTEAPPVTKELGTLEDALVILDTQLPWDSSYIKVTGIVMGGEGWENIIDFTLDDMRDLQEYEPIFIHY